MNAEMQDIWTEFLFLIMTKASSEDDFVKEEGMLHVPWEWVLERFGHLEPGQQRRVIHQISQLEIKFPRALCQLMSYLKGGEGSTVASRAVSEFATASSELSDEALRFFLPLLVRSLNLDGAAASLELRQNVESNLPASKGKQQAA